MNQIKMATLNQLITEDHAYRKVLNLIDLKPLCRPLIEMDHTILESTGLGSSHDFNACCLTEAPLFFCSPQ